MNDKLCSGNNMAFTDEFITNMIMILLEEASDDFWKILKYGSTDATTNPLHTISDSDKLAMIKQENVDGNGKLLTRIRRLKFNDDITTEAHTEIRIFDGSWIVPTLVDYDIIYGIEIISANSIICLKDGRTTLNILRNEIYRIFNGRTVDKNIGRLSNVGVGGSIAVFNKMYQGYQFGLRGSSA